MSPMMAFASERRGRGMLEAEARFTAAFDHVGEAQVRSSSTPHMGAR